MGHVFYHGRVIKTHNLHTESHNLCDSFTHGWCSAFLTDTCREFNPRHPTLSHPLPCWTSLLFPPYPEPFGIRKAWQSNSHADTCKNRWLYRTDTHCMNNIQSDNPWLSNHKWTTCKNLPAITNADIDHTSILYFPKQITSVYAIQFIINTF